MHSQLPLGQSSFQTIRVRNGIYVDKTALISALAQQESRIFLARPRRFGKTLLISTIESLFKDGLKYFDGLSIARTWRDATYPVVRLDFSEIKIFSSASVFKAKLDEKLRAVFAGVGFRWRDNGGSVLSQLSSFLAAQPPASFVILIDEYDAPLTSSLENHQLLKAVQSILNEFFLVLKSNEACLRFFFMTGITWLCRRFDLFDDLADTSLDPGCGRLLGFADEELRASFAPQLRAAARALHLSDEALFAALKKNYGGYAFDGKASVQVHNPWSVLNFLSRPDRGFRAYWFESGGRPTVLRRYLKNHALQSPSAYGASISYPLAALRAPWHPNEIDPVVLLLEAGYLTLKHVAAGDFAMLGYPNDDVAVSMAQLYAEDLLREDRAALACLAGLEKILATETLDKIAEAFNHVFAAIDCSRHPIDGEAACCAFLQILMIGLARIPCVDVRQALGHSELVVETERRRWRFVVRCVKQTSEAGSRIEELGHETIDETIDERHAKGGVSEKKVMRAALAFSDEARAFVAWRMISPLSAGSLTVGRSA